MHIHHYLSFDRMVHYLAIEMSQKQLKHLIPLSLQLQIQYY